MKQTDWRDIVEQVRYWDAMDLLENLEHEMEKARSGMIHCHFELGPGIPLRLTSYEFALSPKIRTVGDRLQIEFEGIHDVKKDEVNVSIESGLLDILIRQTAKDGRESIGRFMLRLPAGIDTETCEAELSKGMLIVCLKKGTKPAKKRIDIR